MTRQDLIAHCPIHGETIGYRTAKGKPYCKECAKSGVVEYRRQAKRRIVSEVGGACVHCGYDDCMSALDFHHTGHDKSFSLGSNLYGYAKMKREAAKCELTCQVCHRQSHRMEDHLANHFKPSQRKWGIVRSAKNYRKALRKRRKLIEAMGGGRCAGCHDEFHPFALDFHHVDHTTKSFPLASNSMGKAWGVLIAEARKCDLLCANCHREVHAGKRTIKKSLASSMTI